MQLAGTAYFVGDRPQVTWAWDLEDRNLRFLRGIDGGYFNHIALSQSELLESDSRHFAAAALRVAYGQALETLFALAAAAVQAPRCVLGWMLAYRNDELVEIVQGMTTGSPSVEHDATVVDATLEGLARSVMNATQYEQDKRDRLAGDFALAWRRWAAEFLDVLATSEYNSFKHGMRASLGGFTLSMGREEAFGEPAPSDAMRSLGGSIYGSEFYCAEHLDGRRHQFPRRTLRNWSPIGMAHGLQLIAMSIQNIVSYLRIVGGDRPETCRFDTPLASESFHAPWLESVGAISMNMDIVVRKEQIQPLTRDEIMALLTRTIPDEQ